jgi:predicted naringenin-chalcone synthase
MAWHIGDLGFEMRLSAYVPEIIRQQADGLVKQLLRRFHIDIPSVEYFAVHPGGKKILEAVEKSLQISSAQNRFAYDVLRNFGNMSSVTVLFVLHQIWQQARQASHQGASILSMSFGPGLTIESALMRLYHD